jgi:hypothetical protein
MREEVESLEHHAHFSPHVIHVHVRVGDALTSEKYLTGSGFFQEVKAA